MKPTHSEVKRIREAFRASRRYMGIHRAASKRRGGYINETQVLLEIESRGALTISDIADALKVEHSTASRLISRLVLDGYVTKEIDPTNESFRRVVLTSSGSELCAKTHTKVDSKISRALRNLSPDEKRVAIEGLELFASALQRSENEREREV